MNWTLCRHFAVVFLRFVGSFVAVIQLSAEYVGASVLRRQIRESCRTFAVNHMSLYLSRHCTRDPGGILVKLKSPRLVKTAILPLLAGGCGAGFPPQTLPAAALPWDRRPNHRPIGFFRCFL